MSEQTCTICETELKGRFCYNCGQKATNKKTTFFNIIFDFFANTFSVENSFLATFIAVFKRPAFLVNNYYEGNKGVLIAPGKFVLFTSIFLALRFYYFEEPFWGLTLESDSQEYILLGVVFIFPILSSIIVFAKKKNILIRSFISIFYISSFTIIVLSLLELPFLLLKIQISASFLVLIYFAIFGLNSFVFNENKRWYSILLTAFLQLLILVAILVILIIILSFYFPESVHLG